MNARVGTSVLLLLLVAACSERSPERDSPGRALIVAAPGDGFGLGGDAELGLYPINANIYEPLLRLTADFRPAPSLATRWEFVPPNTWRFHLRRDVRVRWMW